MQITKRINGLTADLYRKNHRDFWLKAAVSFAGMAMMGAWGITYAHTVEPDWVEVTYKKLKLPRLDPKWNGFRLVQISDIHVDGWMNRSRLESLVASVNSLHPDLIAITGDFVTHNPAMYMEDMVAALSKLSAPYGKMAILGNHDHWSNPAVVRQVIRRSGIAELNNRICSLSRDGSQLHLAGVDDVINGCDRLDLVLKSLPESGAAILLAHEPDFADIAAAAGRFDLQLSGHSHGGQVYFPLIGAPALPRLARKYPRGHYHIDGMQLYTNRGLGMVHMKLRFNSRPEISLFELSAG